MNRRAFALGLVPSTAAAQDTGANRRVHFFEAYDGNELAQQIEAFLNSPDAAGTVVGINYAMRSSSGNLGYFTAIVSIDLL